jgi:hypothetical protein
LVERFRRKERVEWRDIALWRNFYSVVALESASSDQRTTVRPKLQSLSLLPRTNDRNTVRSDWDVEIDPEESDFRVAQKRMLEQIVAIPATLYFPSGIVAELNEICESLGVHS